MLCTTKYKMKIFNSQALKELDLATCEAQDIDSIQLMERAAEAVSLEVISRFLPRQRIVVIAGPGNNGGDALAVARLLIEQGYKKVEVFLFNVGGKLSHDCDEERKKLITIEGVDFTEVRREFNPPYLDENDVVIDGLFGSGLRMPLQGGFKSVAQFINESGAYIVSIDVPSGLFGEWNSGAVRRDMVHADLTLSMQLPRLAFFFEENAEVIGEWKLLDIDLDKEKMREMPSDFMLMEARSIRPLVRRRDPFTAKRDYGSVLLMAGSMGMMGAAVLSARAALKSGAGLATVHSASCGMAVVQTAVPEAIFEPDRKEHFISDMTPHHNHQVIAAGPGIGTRDETVNALESLIKTTTTPLVLDADALNCIAKRPALLQMLPPATVITPHVGEFDRIFGESGCSEQRLMRAVEAAKKYNIIIVLKGHFTAIVRPTGRVYFNSTGNAGMATAGSGDVLTGVIAAFMAQGYRPEHAASVGVYVHGMAGDIAAEEKGEFGMTAGDIADNVGRAIMRILNGEF